MQSEISRPRRASVGSAACALGCAFFFQPARATDLAALLAEAEQHNPAILAARSRAEAAGYLAQQAEAPFDPMVSVAYTNDGLDELTIGESPEAGLALTWQQDLRYPGTRRLAADAAASEQELRFAEVDRLRQQFQEQVKRLYAELYRLDRTLEIQLESRQTLTAAAQVARVRYEVGEGIQESVLRALTDISRLDADIDHTRRLRREAAFALSAALGREEYVPLPPTSTLPDATLSDEELASLAEKMTADSPEVREARARVRREQLKTSLARRQLKPDLSWNATYENRGGLDPLVGGALGIRLPLHRQRRQFPAIAQAEAELAAARHELAAAELRARVAARDMADEARHAGLLVRHYGDTILPQAQSAVDAARAAYGVGQVELFVLLEDLNRLFDYRIREVTERVHRVQAIASLEAALGVALLDVSENRSRS